MTTYHRRFVNLIVTAGIAIAATVGDRILDYPKSWIWEILPNAMWRIRADVNIRKSLAVSFLASVIAWLLGIVLGYLLGVVTGAILLRGKNSGTFHYSAQVLNKVYEGIYIIPFVLTVSFTYAVTTNLYYANTLPGWAVVLVLTTVAGLALGGWHVYNAVYSAVNTPVRENEYLIESLYCRFCYSGSWWHRLRASFRKVKRLRDCEIKAFSANISKALFLAIVAIMIVEAVTPHIYELIVPQHGPTSSWLGGIGRLIVDSQGTYEYQKIAGCIWAILFFTWILDFAAYFCLRRCWLRFYGD